MYSLAVRQGIKSLFIHLLWISIALYFVYHIIIGARGIISWGVLSREATQLERELQELKSANYFLENKVKGMRSESLDLDLLEEQASKILGFAYPNETIVLLPKD